MKTEFGSISQRHGSADPDPHQNVMDPQHWDPHLFALLDPDPDPDAVLKFILVVK